MPCAYCELLVSKDANDSVATLAEALTAGRLGWFECWIQSGDGEGGADARGGNRGWGSCGEGLDIVA